MGNLEIRPIAAPKRTPYPIVTKRCTRDYVIDMYRHAKFSHDPSRGFFSMCARNCASKMFTRLLCSSNDPQPRPWTDFHAKYVKRRGSAQGCAFSGLENKNLTFNPPLFQKRHFCAGFWRDLKKIFDQKPLYNGDAPCKLPLIVIVAP